MELNELRKKYEKYQSKMKQIEGVPETIDAE